MYDRWTDDYRQQWVQSLRPLSMTCKRMRLRLLPWIWGRLEIKIPLPYGWDACEIIAKKLNTAANYLRVDTLLATSVTYICAFLCSCVGSDFCSLTKVPHGISPVVRTRLSLVR